MIKKVFSREYPEDNAKDVSEWIEKELYNADGSIKIFRPTIIVEILDQQN